MAQRDLLVHGGKQGAGTAGEVGDAQCTYGIRVAPVHAVHHGYGQPGQQSGGSRQSVERRQVFAVGNQALKDTPGQIMGNMRAGGVDAFGGQHQPPENARGGIRG